MRWCGQNLRSCAPSTQTAIAHTGWPAAAYRITCSTPDLLPFAWPDDSSILVARLDRSAGSRVQRRVSFHRRAGRLIARRRCSSSPTWAPNPFILHLYAALAEKGWA